MKIKCIIVVLLGAWILNIPFWGKKTSTTLNPGRNLCFALITRAEEAPFPLPPQTFGLKEIVKALAPRIRILNLWCNNQGVVDKLLKKMNWPIKNPEAVVTLVDCYPDCFHLSTLAVIVVGYLPLVPSPFLRWVLKFPVDPVSHLISFNKFIFHSSYTKCFFMLVHQNTGKFREVRHVQS